MYLDPQRCTRTPSLPTAYLDRATGCRLVAPEAEGCIKSTFGRAEFESDVSFAIMALDLRVGF